jgi:hypothetical protein
MTEPRSESKFTRAELEHYLENARALLRKAQDDEALALTAVRAIEQEIGTLPVEGAHGKG